MIEFDLNLFALSQEDKKILLTFINLGLGKVKLHVDKADRATMRPECVSACIDYVTYMERQMDKQTDETT